MSYIEIGGRRHSIPTGETTLGTDSSNQIALGVANPASQSAVLQGLPDGQVAIRRANPNSNILVNGVKLGPQPTPLLHGDKIEVAGQELLFVDDRRSGSTQYIQAVTPASMETAAKSASSGVATAGTGGRLVCLTDGREYVVSRGSLLIGREAGCDVVVSSKNVSRRHAEIVATPRGYLIIDSSTNGTFVNGKRIEGQHVLARADVIRCGDYEFRFYADVVEAAPPVAPGPPPPPAGAQHRLADTMHGIPTPKSQPAIPDPAQASGAEHRLADTMLGIPAPERPSTPPAAPKGPPTPPPGAGHRLADTMHGIPPEDIGRVHPRTGEHDAREDRTARDAAAPPLAAFIVRTGLLKGQRLPVRLPIVNIGRANYNDVVLPDDSVSTLHAKLQRREGVWMLEDQGSTNGTLVDGLPVEGEAALPPGAIVRFGSVQTIFEPLDDSAEIQKGGSTRVIHSFPPPPPPAGPSRPGSSGLGPGSQGGGASPRGSSLHGVRGDSGRHTGGASGARRGSRGTVTGGYRRRLARRSLQRRERGHLVMAAILLALHRAP